MNTRAFNALLSDVRVPIVSIEAVSYELYKLHTKRKLIRTFEYKRLPRIPKIRTHCFGLKHLYRSQQRTSIN